MPLRCESHRRKGIFDRLFDGGGARMALKDRFPALLLFNNVTGMTALFSRRVALAAMGASSTRNGKLG